MPLRETVRTIDQRFTRPLVLPEAAVIARGVALVIAHTGDSVVWAALLILSFVFGGAVWKARSLLAAGGLVVAELAVFAIKLVVRRRRPPGTSGMIYRRVDPYSFPSGHAARAAMLLVFSAVLCPPACTAAIAGWAPVMVLSRVAIGIHFFLDVLVGAALGTGLAYGVLGLAPLVLSLF